MGESTDSQLEGKQTPGKALEEQHRAPEHPQGMKHAASGNTPAPEPPSPSIPCSSLRPAPPEPPWPLTGRGCPAPDPNPSPGSGVCSAVPIHSTATAPPRRGQGHPCHLLPALSRGDRDAWGARPPCLTPAGSHVPQPPQAIRVPPETPPAQSRAPWQSQPPK